MSFFNPRKQKIIKEIKGDLIAFNIKYYKSKAPEKYKVELLSKIIGTIPALAVINTRFMYKEQKNNYLKGQQELLEQLNSSGINYRRIPVKRKEEMSIFGLTVRQGEEKFYQDHVYGLIVDSSGIEAIIKLFGSYSLYYFVDCGDCSTEEILDIFEASFDDEETLKAQFKYFIVDDNFMGNMVIYCEEQAAAFISSMLA